MYEFQNVRDRTMAAQAIPSYAPRQAMAHFNKLECFCFNEYTLKPGESKQVAGGVRHRPQAAARRAHDHAVSYTFFEGRRHRRCRRGAERGSGDGLTTRCSATGSFVPRHARGGLVVLRRAQGARDYEHDVAQLNPVHVIIAGVIGAFVFVGVLVLVVNWIVGQPAAWQNPGKNEESGSEGDRHVGNDSAIPRADALLLRPQAPRASGLMAAIGLFFVILGAGQWVNGHGWGAWVTLFGFLMWLAVLFQLVPRGHRRAKGGLYGSRVDVSFRWSMSWFIFSR